jgi:N-acetylmuramoyl-L-alanine amidase
MKTFSVLFLFLILFFNISANDQIKEEDRLSLTKLLQDLTSEPDKKLEDIKVWPGENSIRVAIYPSDKVKYKYNLLPGEKDDRIYIDLLSVDSDGFVLPEIEHGAFLKGIRMGRRDNGLRIVLDTSKVETYSVVEMEEPWRIVIDYYGKKEEPPVELDKKGEIVKKDKPPVTVVIDPGHGGKDPGAVAGDLYEKDIVLKLAKKIKKLSKEYKLMEIKLTRSNDTFLALEERAAIANTMNGNLFISLHANAFSDKNVGGVEIYHLDNTRDDYTDRLAMVENKISDSRSLLNTILVGMEMSHFVKDSLMFATDLGPRLRKELKPFGVRVRGYKKGALFYVLVGARMPSLLVEIGYLTNDKEKKLLTDDKYLDTIARSILDSIDNVIKKEPAVLKK